MLRRLWLGAIGLAGFALLGTAAAWVTLPRIDLSAYAQRRLGEKLGRPVTIGKLHVSPGRWLGVEIEGLRLANIPGGTESDMVTLDRAHAEIDIVSLLHGPATIRHVAISGLAILLEHADGQKNWTGRVERAKPGGQPDRSKDPLVLDADLHDVGITYRSTAGHSLTTMLDRVALDTDAVDKPVTLTASGTYNAAPVSLAATLQSFAVLRDARTPFGIDLHMASRQTSLHFHGSMTDPLNADGAAGTLDVAAPVPSELLALAGVTSTNIPPISLAGSFTRQGDVWTHTNANGTIKDMPFHARILRLEEGAGGRPDRVTADLSFERLDLGFLNVPDSGKGKTNPPISLSVDRTPGAVIDAKLAASQLAYGDLAFGDAKIDASLTPGRIALDAVSLSYLGARGHAAASITAEGDGGRIAVDAAIAGIDVQKLRRTLGMGKMPLTGALDAKLSANASGKTVADATRDGNISAVLAMNGGTIPREVIEMASTDVRVLLRKAPGAASLSCLLAIASVKSGKGTLAPLRIRTAQGSIAGSGQFDLYGRTLDLVIGSKSATTSAFALDIPVRISGSFKDPAVSPAKLTAKGRALLASADTVPALPPALTAMVNGSACSRK